MSINSSPSDRDRFSGADESVRCSIIELLTRIPCASDGTLTLISGGMAGWQCSFCSKQGNQESRPSPRDVTVQVLVAAIFAKLIGLSSFRESRRPRIIAMIALRRIILHSDDPEILDIEKSVLGKWSLQAIQSSLRELRIAAGRAIKLFLEPEVGEHVGPQVLSRNAANALAFLKSVSDKNEPNISETCLMAWGQMGKVVSDEGLNLVLVKMLEFLGHPNPIISAVALNEITNLASYRKTTPRRLLEPFWRNLAYSTVKDMFTRPQTTQMVADLLKTNVTELLLLIQSHALPWLVLHRKKDIIQKFLEARREALPPGAREKEGLGPMLFLDDANLCTILSRLLVQDVPDIQAYARSVLIDVSEDDTVNLKELLSSSAVPTTMELLKMSGEGDASTRTSVSLFVGHNVRTLTVHQARSALAVVAGLLTPPAKDGRKKGHHTVGRFLAAHALGLSTGMIEVINNTSPVPPPIQERKRCIRAMEEMIVLAKEYIRTARPQVCLQSQQTRHIHDTDLAADFCLPSIRPCCR